MIKLLMSKREESSASLTAQYGIESVMPKAQGSPSDPVYQEIVRIEKYDRNIKNVREKVMFVQNHSQYVTNTKNKVILDMLLDGMTLRDVATELGMSLSNVGRRKTHIVNQMYSAQCEQNGKNGKSVINFS